MPISEQGSSTAPAAPASFAELMARDASKKTAANAVSQISIPDGEGRADGETAQRDWNFGDENEDEDGDQVEDLFLPPSQNFCPSSIDHLDEQMRFNGLRWRYEPKRRVAKDPNLQNLRTWIQHHPSPMDEPTRTLAEMIGFDPQGYSSTLSRTLNGHGRRQHVDANRHVRTLRLPHDIPPRVPGGNAHEEKPAGGIECALIYSFFMQHQALPQYRTEDEIIATAKGNRLGIR
jgi:hypothetical protein